MDDESCGAGPTILRDGRLSEAFLSDLAVKGGNRADRGSELLEGDVGGEISMSDCDVPEAGD
jgi:hypothetical protein